MPHLREMVVVIKMKRYLPWRGVGNEREVLNFLNQSNRDTKASARLIKRLIHSARLSHVVSGIGGKIGPIQLLSFGKCDLLWRCS